MFIYVNYVCILPGTVKWHVTSPRSSSAWQWSSYTSGTCSSEQAGAMSKDVDMLMEILHHQEDGGNPWKAYK